MDGVKGTVVGIHCDTRVARALSGMGARNIIWSTRPGKVLEHLLFLGAVIFLD